MATITIRNVGPIKDLTLNLNKVNIFMGPQSSGKSTIAKIISFCSWVEKERITTLGSYDISEFISKLESFYNMEDYVNGDSEITYKSDTLQLSYTPEGMFASSIDAKYIKTYKRPKIFYIPAERHVALLPEIMKVDFPDNNLRNYIFDWLTARSCYPKEGKINLPGLNANYYYDEKRKEDKLVMDNNKELLLSNASSGLQSVTPLIVLTNYFTEWIYGHEEVISYEKKLRNKQIENHFQSDATFVRNLTKPQYTRLILEEPEQNLFPSAQRDLLYYMLRAICSGKHAHQLILTTHSPYILYALNNAMMAYLVKGTMPDKESSLLPCFPSKISPKEVAVWEIEDGRIRSVQDSDGIIAENYFDQKLTELTDEYYTMLNYYEE